MQTFKVPDDVPIESGLVSRAVNQAQTKIEGFNFDIRRHLLDFDDILNKQRIFIYGQRQKILTAIDGLIPLATGKSDFRSLLKEITAQELSDEEKTKLNPELEIFLGQQILRIMDLLWMENLENLESLRETVNLRAYGQHEPLVEYRQESYRLFKEFQANFRNLASETISKILANPITISPEQKIDSSASANALTDKKLNRNDPCWCGSGKKYKKCHGK